MSKMSKENHLANKSSSVKVVPATIENHVVDIQTATPTKILPTVLATAEQQALVDTAPTKILQDLRSLEQRVDAMVFNAGVNDALLRQQLAERHAKMQARMEKRNGIRMTKFKGKLNADVAHVMDDVLNYGSEVKLPAMLDARINAIVLKAQMGAGMIQKELNARREAMLKRLEGRNKKRLVKIQMVCEEERNTVEHQILNNKEATIQLPAGGGIEEVSLDEECGKNDEQEQSLVQLERRVDCLIVASGADVLQLPEYLKQRHTQMKARVVQRNKIRKARLANKLDAEALNAKAELAKGKQVELPSIPDMQIDAMVLLAQMSAQVVNNELGTRKAAMLARLAKRNQAKLERKKLICNEETKQISLLLEAGGGTVTKALELPAEDTSEDDSLDVPTAVEEEVKKEMLVAEAEAAKKNTETQKIKIMGGGRRRGRELPTPIPPPKPPPSLPAANEAAAEDREAKIANDKQLAKKATEEAVALVQEEQKRQEAAEKLAREAQIKRELEEALLTKQMTTLQNCLEKTMDPNQFDLVTNALTTLQKNPFSKENKNKIGLMEKAQVLLTKLERVWLLKQAVASKCFHFFLFDLVF